MPSIAVYYRPPEDNEAFEKGYIADHLPMVDDWPNIKDKHFGRVSKNVAGDFPYSHVFLGRFDDQAGLEEALASEAMGRAVKDAQERAPQGFDAVVIDWLA